ncbi:helix-turn-helix domain-containing protein [Actinoplanes awajinensis]|uniref:HTH cro/C1-type domain-containing protein n=1 Tax=Actinoplanes awajinensis subsp. mycoplanecinus TaxID=135947 RepID=A0A117MN86_9ACTN|nr:helix-turn-helix transcriptional regulator [Actinoplanes awajinensis]KUL26692.1 hypothetical protein ADL15_37400 [Actinoplanes awajinensis subsp. mycoplanecinus]
MTKLDDTAADAFATTLTRLRETRQLSKKDLAARMGFDPSYVSHVEGGRHRPTLEFARRAEVVLDGGGALMRTFQEPGTAAPGTAAGWPIGGTASLGSELFVEQEDSDLRLADDGYYEITISRTIRNIGQRPLTRFPTRIEVDAFPADPARSHSFYRDNPVTLAETAFWARFDGEPTAWRVVRDRDAYKKIEIFFEPSRSLRPVYPGQSAVVTCGYRVHHRKWGAWFTREIRWPTMRISGSLTFPRHTGARLSGRRVSWTGDQPLGEAPARSESADGTVFTWTVTSPTLANLYHFQWRFHGL